MAKDEVAVEVGANNRGILTMPPWCSQGAPIIPADQEGNFKLSVWTNRKGLPPTIGSNSFNGFVISCHDGVILGYNAASVGGLLHIIAMSPCGPSRRSRN